MIMIDTKAIIRHKILAKLLKEVNPCENKETWANGIKGVDDRIYGTQTITLGIANNWKSAEAVDTCTFKTYYTVRISHYNIKGTKVEEDFDKGMDDPRDGIFYTDYNAAVKHLEEHRQWFVNNYPKEVYKGCGAAGCRFCDKFAEIGKVPETL